MLGDFVDAFEAVEAALEAGTSVRLGFCEGHRATVEARRGTDGRLWFVHVALARRKGQGTPGAVEVPPARRRRAESASSLAGSDVEAAVSAFVEQAIRALPTVPRGAPYWRQSREIAHRAYRLKRLYRRIDAPMAGKPSPAAQMAGPAPSASEILELLGRVLRELEGLPRTTLRAHARTLCSVIERLDVLNETTLARAAAVASETWASAAADAERPTPFAHDPEWTAGVLGRLERRVARLQRQAPKKSRA